MSRNTDLILGWTEPATRESNNALYPAVVAGDSAAREQMIRSNTGMVITKVDLFLALFPQFGYLRDDLIEYGIVGLTEAVNQMVTDGPQENVNPTSLMGICMQRHIGAAIEKEQSIRVPRRTQRRKRKQGIIIDPPDKESTIFHEEGDEQEHPFSYDPRRMQDLRETIDACCENDAERTIVRMREEGYVDREIAAALDLPPTTTYVMRRALYARFLDLTGWKGQV